MTSLAFASLALLLDAAVVLVAGRAQFGHATGLRAVLREAMAVRPLVAHLLVTGLLFSVHWQLRRRLGAMSSAIERAPGTSLLLALMLFLGPLGTVVGWLTACVACLIPTSWATMADSVEAEPPPAPAQNQQKQPLSGTVEPQSLCDVFRNGTLAQRRSAVALIGANFKPQFADALRMALTDPTNAIRVQAGMVLLQLEDDYGRRQVRLESQADSEMATHGFGTDQSQLELARLHDTHAYSGLLDGNRTKTAQILALQAYRNHLAVYPGDEEAIAAVGRLLIRADQHELVADWLGQQLAQGRNAVSIVMWLAEALYRSQRYAELQAIVRVHGDRLAHHLPADSPLHGFLTLWRPSPGRPSGAHAPHGAFDGRGR